MISVRLALTGLLCLSPLVLGAQGMHPDGATSATTPQSMATAARPVDPQHNPIATGWIAAAEGKLKAKDTAGAAQMLMQAKQLNDHERGLWLVTGDVDWRRSQLDQAIEDYKREVSRYPDNVLVYSRLTSAYLSQGEWDAAEQTERDWAKAAPHDVAPRAVLGYALMMTEHYGESAAAYEDAIALNIKPELLKVQLGRAQLRSGQAAAGEATLRTLLSQSKDAAVLNGAAYELGDAGLDLPEAEVAAHKATAMVSDLSAAVRLESASDDDLALMPLLAKSWDTLGWIMFKQHRLAEAESYVRCAWLLGNHDEFGLHLGQIYEAEGKKNEAIATDRMAAGLIASQHPWPYYAHMRETLLARVETLQQGASPQTALVGADAYAADELRTYTIANPASGFAATAEFLLHMTNGRVDGVRFLRGDTSLKAAEGALETTEYNVAMPTISRARLLRRATLNCMPGSATCTLRLKGIHSARMEE